MVSALADEFTVVIDRAGSDRDASRLNCHLFEGFAGRVARIFAIHLDRLGQGFAQIGNEFIAGCALGVHARHFLDPANPPRPVLTNDGSVSGRLQGVGSVLEMCCGASAGGYLGANSASAIDQFLETVQPPVRWYEMLILPSRTQSSSAHAWMRHSSFPAV